MKLELLIIALGLARDAISSGCKRQYLIPRMIKMETYTSEPQTDHPQLGPQ